MTKRIFLNIIGIVSVLIVIILISASAYLATHLELFEQLLISKVEDTTGRKFAAKDVQISLSLTPSVTLKDVRLENAGWSDKPQMLRASSLTLKINLAPLMKGVVEIDQLIFDTPEIVIETNAKGISNWDFQQESAKQKQASGQNDEEGWTPDFEVRQIKISNGQSLYRNGITGTSDSTQIEHFSGKAIDAKGAFKFELKATYEKTPFTSNGTMDSVHAFFQNKPYRFDLTIESAGGQLHGKGSVERPMDFDWWNLDLAVKAEMASNLSWIAGIELPAFGPVEASSHIKEQQSGYQLDQLKAKIRESDFSGSITFDTEGKRLKIVSQLTSTQISTVESTSDKAVVADQESSEVASGDSDKEQSDRIFSADPFPFTALNQFDADITLHTDKLNLVGNPLQNLDLKLLLEDGLLTMKDATIEVGSGTLTADLVIDSKPEIPNVTTSIHASQIDLGDWFRAVKNEDILTGSKMDADIELSGQGNSIRDLAAGLNGHAKWSAGEGQLRYDVGLADRNLIFAIAHKLNPMTKEDKDVQLRCWTVNYDIKDGIATSDRGLAFDSDKLQLLGTGSIDLKTEKFNLYVTSDSTVAGLIAVGGTLAKPEVHLNPAGVAKEGASIGAAILTLGLSLIPEHFYHWIRDSKSPCEVAQRDRSKQD